MCFRYESEQRTVTIETPGAALLYNFYSGFIVTVEQFICHSARWGLIGEFQRLRTKPLHAYDRDQRVRQNAAHRCVGSEIF